MRLSMHPAAKAQPVTRLACPRLLLSRPAKQGGLVRRSRDAAALSGEPKARGPVTMALVRAPAPPVPLSFCALCRP